MVANDVLLIGVCTNQCPGSNRTFDGNNGEIRRVEVRVLGGDGDADGVGDGGGAGDGDGVRDGCGDGDE
jgi:hypothetical protein